MTLFGWGIFLAGWIYAISAFGIFLGVGVGWSPAHAIAWLADAALLVLIVLAKGLKAAALLLLSGQKYPIGGCGGHAPHGSSHARGPPKRFFAEKSLPHPWRAARTIRSP